MPWRLQSQEDAGGLRRCRGGHRTLGGPSAPRCQEVAPSPSRWDTAFPASLRKEHTHWGAQDVSGLGVPRGAPTPGLPPPWGDNICPVDSPCPNAPWQEDWGGGTGGDPSPPGDNICKAAPAPSPPSRPWVPRYPWRWEDAPPPPPQPLPHPQPAVTVAQERCSAVGTPGRRRAGAPRPHAGAAEPGARRG